MVGNRKRRYFIMRSMTGYGKAEYSKDGLDLVIEIKTVNNRNFDLNARTPRAFIAFDDLIRKTVQKYVLRARIDLFITYTDKRERANALTVDLDRAASYYDAAKAIADKLNLKNDVSVSSLLKSPDVVTENAADDESDLSEIVESVLISACENLNAMREKEGEKLCADVLSRMDEIEVLREKIAERAPLVVKEYKEKLTARIVEALMAVNYDEAKLLNEVAFFTDKANIDEELTRLKSHIGQFREIIKTEGCGKKLDFLMQEFNRETNTICSKANDITVTNVALSLKNEIEKVREQVQNLE